MRHLAIILLTITLLAGCAGKHPEGETHETETRAQTIWTANTELFMEHDEPEAGGKTGFLLHLTSLKDFKPVSEGPLTITFTPEKGEPVTVTIEKPQRPGIFKTDVVFKEEGSYALKISLQGKALTDEITAKPIDVLGKSEMRTETARIAKGGSDISFLKEQQWTIDFKVGRPARESVASSFVATGEIIPVATAEVTLSSPLAGVLSPSKQLPHIGKKVTKGETLALIEPPVILQGGLGQLAAAHVEAKNRHILAQKEYERAKSLLEAKAVPKRRLEEAELSLESAQAVLAPLDKAMEEMKHATTGNSLIVRAPLGGTVTELYTSNGKAIEAGQPLVKIINTTTVWLRVNVPATEIGGLKNLNTATFTIPGIDGEIRPSRLITVNDVVDPKTRTVPVIFEVTNAGGRLKIGMFADVSILTGHADSALTLPDEALFEDEGRFFVFVLKNGESFERREIKTGLRGRGRVQIISGIGEDERVVLKGGYYVKLASLSSRGPQGHGHDH